MQPLEFFGAEVVVGACTEHGKHPVETDLRVVVSVGDRVTDHVASTAGDAILQEPHTDLVFFLRRCIRMNEVDVGVVYGLGLNSDG